MLVMHHVVNFLVLTCFGAGDASCHLFICLDKFLCRDALCPLIVCLDKFWCWWYIMLCISLPSPVGSVFVCLMMLVMHHSVYFFVLTSFDASDASTAMYLFVLTSFDAGDASRCVFVGLWQILMLVIHPSVYLTVLTNFDAPSCLFVCFDKFWCWWCI